MSSSNVVGIFWDLGGFGHSNGHGTFYLSAAHQPAENIRPPREGTCERPGLDIPSQIYKVASDYGCVKEFRAYSEFPAQSSHKGIQLREDLTVSGVTLRDCVHNNRKEVVDKIIIVDMMTFAMDNPASSNSTIILITNDHGYVYPMNILRARKYRVIVLATSEADAGLKHKGDNFIDWERVVLGPIRKNSSRSNKSPVNVSPSSAAWTQSTTPSPSPRCKRSPTYSPSGGSSMEPLNPHQPPFLVVSKTPNIPAYGHPPQRETTTLMQGSTPPISNEPESPPMIRRMSLKSSMEDLNLGVCVPSDRVIHEPYDATMMTSSPNSSPLYAQQQIYIQSSTTTACSSFASSPPSNVVQRCPLLISPLPNRSSESGDLGRANISSRQLHRPRATIPLRLQPEVSSPFIHLVNILIELSQKDGTTSKIKRSLVGGKLASQKFPYDEHGFRDFKDYTVKAQEEGVVVLGGDSGTAWIALPGADDVNQVEA